MPVAETDEVEYGVAVGDSSENWVSQYPECPDCGSPMLDNSRCKTCPVVGFRCVSNSQVTKQK